MNRDIFKVLVMGLPGSGKITLADNIFTLLKQKNKNTVRIDATEVRSLHNDWDFSFEGRINQAKRLAEIANNEKFKIVICSAVMPIVECINAFDPQHIIWMDTISESMFEDTNKMWKNPEMFDFRVENVNDINLNDIVDDIIQKTFHRKNWNAMDNLFGNDMLWGCVQDNKQYGVYDMITNRIVLTYHKRFILEYVVELFSSRFNFKLVDLSTAENFSEDVIDNSCCTNWTISNYSDLSNISTGLRLKTKTFTADKIIKSPSETDYSLITNTQKYMHLAIRVAEWFNGRLSITTSVLSGLETDQITHEDFDYNFDNIFIEKPFNGDYDEQGSLTKFISDRKKAFNIIYKEFDFDKAKTQLFDIINEYYK